MTQRDPTKKKNQDPEQKGYVIKPSPWLTLRESERFDAERRRVGLRITNQDFYTLLCKHGIRMPCREGKCRAVPVYVYESEHLDVPVGHYDHCPHCGRLTPGEGE